MYLKIYFNDKPLFLCDAIDDSIAPYTHHDDAVLIDELSPQAVNSMLHEMALPKVHAGIFLHPDLATLKAAFWKKFTLVKAAGGLVFNSRNEMLVINRRSKWDLPKGKLDDGESLPECALREVQEETGVEGLQLNELLVTTYHTYHESGKFILKENYWYRMYSSTVQELLPQAEEGITAVRWVPLSGIKSLMENTFPSIREVLKAAALE